MKITTSGGTGVRAGEEDGERRRRREREREGEGEKTIWRRTGW